MSKFLAMGLGVLALLLVLVDEHVDRLDAQDLNKSEKSSVQEDVRQIPLGLISPTFPSGTPPSHQETALGKQLFSDALLSNDGTISCASCHDPQYVFAEPRPLPRGLGGALGRRHSPSLLNIAFFTSFSWDGRHTTIEDQALSAISNPDEMGLELHAVADRVEAKYGAHLRQVYGAVSAVAVAKALASYQRTLVAGDSPFDRYLYLGKASVISESAKRGFEIFLRQGRCIQCHVIRCEECHPFGGSTALFTNNRFHNLGIGFDKPEGERDLGRGAVTGRLEDTGAFKTPSLRNVALTAPYMHDGSLATLEDVIEHYNKGGIPNLYLDPEIRPLNLTEQEKRDLVELLKSLTSMAWQ
jgi:cytochrome c peroxidase